MGSAVFDMFIAEYRAHTREEFGGEVDPNYALAIQAALNYVRGELLRKGSMAQQWVTILSWVCYEEQGPAPS